MKFDARFERQQMYTYNQYNNIHQNEDETLSFR